MSDEQLSALRDEGNRLHKQLGVKIIITNEHLLFSWKNTLDRLSFPASVLLTWGEDQDAIIPTYLLDFRDDYYIDLDRLKRLTLPLTELIKNPDGKIRLEVLIALAESSVESMNNPGSIMVAELHRHLAVTDQNYAICAQQALDPLYENLRIGVSQKALTIEREKGIKVPQDLVGWFYFR